MTHPIRHIVATAPTVVRPLPDGWSLWTHGYAEPPERLSAWINERYLGHEWYRDLVWTGRTRQYQYRVPAIPRVLGARVVDVIEHEMRAPHAVYVGDRWLDPATLSTRAYDPYGIGRWVDTTRRLMRAVAGTPVPDGWTVVDDPEPLAVWAPLALDQWRAQDIADMARQTPQTTVVVSDRPDERDRWEAWRGVGGYAQSVGRYPTRDEARDAVIAQIEAWRAEHAWLARVAPWPTIEVIDARSPGWLEVDGTRQALTAEVEALAADGLLILDEPVDDAVTRLIERRYRPGRLRAELTTTRVLD